MNIGALRIINSIHCKISRLRALFDQGRWHRPPLQTHEGARTKKALLLYLGEPCSDLRNQSHNNVLTNTIYYDVLQALCYEVTAIRHDINFDIDPCEFDLLLGMGAQTQRLAQVMQRKAVKIYLSTGSEFAFNNREERKRLESLRRRKGVSLLPRRLTTIDAQTFMAESFDAVFCNGNGVTASSFENYSTRIFPIGNHYVPRIKAPKRDYRTAVRKRFLYLASGGQVHRGLDLVLDVFSARSDCELIICAPVKEEEDFYNLYRDELEKKPNIHYVGWVSVPGMTYNIISAMCSFVILPSCAEGAPGSVILGMKSGLIPILTKECGIDLCCEGICLDECDIAHLDRAVCDVLRWTAEELLQKSEAVLKHCKKVYSPVAFAENLTRCLEKTITGKIPND